MAAKNGSFYGTVNVGGVNNSNGVIEEALVLHEEQTRVANHRISDLEDKEK